MNQSGRVMCVVCVWGCNVYEYYIQFQGEGHEVDELAMKSVTLCVCHVYVCVVYVSCVHECVAYMNVIYNWLRRGMCVLGVWVCHVYGCCMSIHVCVCVCVCVFWGESHDVDALAMGSVTSCVCYVYVCIAYMSRVYECVTYMNVIYNFERRVMCVLRVWVCHVDGCCMSICVCVCVCVCILRGESRCRRVGNGERHFMSVSRVCVCCV